MPLSYEGPELTGRSGWRIVLFEAYDGEVEAEICGRLQLDEGIEGIAYLLRMVYFGYIDGKSDCFFGILDGIVDGPVSAP